MKSHRRLVSPENPVNFLKIIPSNDTPSTGIRLPEKFTEEYGKYLLERVTLKVRNGDVWQVGLHKSKDEIWLKNGWGRFVEHYSIGIWHLLMFEYEGSSTFGVIIFDATASEIKYLKHTDRARKCDESKIIILDDDTSSEEDQKHGIKIYEEGECSRKTQRGEEGRLALEEAKANFKSDKPFFMVLMSTSHVTTKRGVCLPMSLRRELLRGHDNRRKCLLLLKSDEKSKAWKVVAQDDRLGNADWRMFVEDNGIKAGDICVLELIHEDEMCLLLQSLDLVLELFVIKITAFCINLFANGSSNKYDFTCQPYKQTITI
ncbi:hypothetical protein L1987_34336 [Smallanthus sonchifolius]|uniref:Uncharacterized protein n=1 Tax=Smallanthus sonchifolius TaxID=185202 RepID=A0ACB9HUE0_9ASTR|nr:hypothetical protein L1987_34336 [Smallanthus sonchifolius]